MSKLAILNGKPVRREPFMSWPLFGDEERKAILQVFESGVWGIGGPKVAEFQEKFAHAHETAYGIAVMNGTVSLEIALRAGNVGFGDEVIIPAYTFVATATAVLSVNATPIFADIDPGSYCIDPEAIRAAITPRARAIIPVHLAGHAADMDTIMDIAREHDLLVLEDAAHAHFAEWKGKKVGSLGHLGSFSFQASKNMCAGEGGIVVTSDPQLADSCWSYHNCGRVRDGRWYQHPYFGSNYRMTEFQAAVLLAQQDRAQKQADIRQERAAYLTEKLCAFPGIAPLKKHPNVTRHGYHLYVVKYDREQFDGLPRWLFIAALIAEGIPASRGYVPLYREGFLEQAKAHYLNIPPYTHQNYRDVFLPQTERASEEGIWLPHHLLLSSHADLDDVVRAFEKVISQYRDLLDANLSEASVESGVIFGNQKLEE